MDTITSPEFAEFRAILTKFAPFIKELKKRLFITLLIFGLSTVAGFVYYEKIISFLIDILSLRGINIVFTSPFQFINLAISCGAATGLILCFPLLITQVLFFLKPALKNIEYRAIVLLLPFSIILFVVGFLFGAYMMKWQIELFLASSQSIGIGNVLDITKLLSTVLLTSSFMGIGFQFPIFMLILLRLGILKIPQLTRVRSWIYLGALIFAILLPIDSILADFLLALPIVLLFEATLIFARMWGTKTKES